MVLLYVFINLTPVLWGDRFMLQIHSMFWSYLLPFDIFLYNNPNHTTGYRFMVARYKQVPICVMPSYLTRGICFSLPCETTSPYQIVKPEGARHRNLISDYLPTCLLIFFPLAVQQTDPDNRIALRRWLNNSGTNVVLLRTIWRFMDEILSSMGWQMATVESVEVFANRLLYLHGVMR